MLLENYYYYERNCCYENSVAPKVFVAVKLASATRENVAVEGSVTKNSK